MIVSCPGCETNYRIPSDETARTRGRCSRCEAEFPLARRKVYRLMPGGSAHRAARGTAVPDMSGVAQPAAAVTASAAAALPGVSAGPDWPDMPALHDSAAVDEAPKAVRSRSARFGRVMLEVFIVSLLVAGGGAAGYYLSLLELPLLEGVDQWTRMAVGAVIGALLAWIVIPRDRQNC